MNHEDDSNNAIRVASLLEKGLLLFGEGDQEGALECWEQVSVLDPGNIKASQYKEYVADSYGLLAEHSSGYSPESELLYPFGIEELGLSQGDESELDYISLEITSPSIVGEEVLAANDGWSLDSIQAKTPFEGKSGAHETPPIGGRPMKKKGETDSLESAFAELESEMLAKEEKVSWKAEVSGGMEREEDLEFGEKTLDYAATPAFQLKSSAPGLPLVTFNNKKKVVTEDVGEAVPVQEELEDDFELELSAENLVYEEEAEDVREDQTEPAADSVSGTGQEFSEVKTRELGAIASEAGATESTSLDALLEAPKERNLRTIFVVKRLLEHSGEKYALQEYEDAANAVVSALRLAGDNAVAQKLVYSNEVELIEILIAGLCKLENIPRLTVPLHELPMGDVDHRAAFLLSRIDGDMSLEEILDVSGMPRLEALCHLSTMNDKNYLSFSS